MLNQAVVLQANIAGFTKQAIPGYILS